MEKETQFTIAFLTSPCKQGIEDLCFCICITRGSTTLSTYSKSNLVCSLLYTNNRRHFVRTIIIISSQNGKPGKTERLQIVCFSIHYEVIHSILFSLLISQHVGSSHQAVSTFQHELRDFTVQTVFT